jgi:hypothetical protein
MGRASCATLAALIATACTITPAKQDSARPAAWHIASVAKAEADPRHKAAAAAILAYFQDSGAAFSRGSRTLCLGFGPASGGPFIAQPLEDLAPALMAQIGQSRPNVRGVSECATTMKGSPYRIEATGELADLVACLHAGDSGPYTVSLLCGYYGGPLTGEFIRYDVDLAPDKAIVRYKGIGIAF